MILKEYSEYLKLVKKNPTLPTLCMVDSDIVADDCCGRWAGQIGSCEIKEYAFIEMYSDCATYVEKDDAEDYEEYLRDRDYTDEQVKQAMQEVPWKKAIVLYIDLPTDFT